ncbi:hypothetical protein BC830DRAFT_193893 [Chytriomyces sp. MP71]|nr:hypothetical protein BC830DRAFT_193893 [Chytriomyces sp. MP71]
MLDDTDYKKRGTKNHRAVRKTALSYSSFILTSKLARDFLRPLSGRCPNLMHHQQKLSVLFWTVYEAAAAHVLLNGLSSLVLANRAKVFKEQIIKLMAAHFPCHFPTPSPNGFITFGKTAASVTALSNGSWFLETPCKPIQPRNLQLDTQH